MRNPNLIPLSFFTLLITACVTINIYFPAAAAEKVADEIIEDIQGNRDPPSDTEEPQTLFRPGLKWMTRVVSNMIGSTISSAHAGQANLSIDNPEIRRIRASMKARFTLLEPYYAQGYIGIDSNGDIVVRDASKIPLKDRSSVNKLVNKENTDRTALYQAIAAVNGHPDWFKNIQTTFASRWISKAHPGWWYRTSNGSWLQKK